MSRTSHYNGPVLKTSRSALLGRSWGAAGSGRCASSKGLGQRRIFVAAGWPRREVRHEQAKGETAVAPASPKSLRDSNATLMAPAASPKPKRPRR
jgi:hypothetical protein